MSQMLVPNHLAAIAVTVLLSVLLCLLARRAPTAFRAVSWPIAAIVIGNELIYVLSGVVNHTFAWSWSLPLYLCDIAALISGVALISRRALLVEITYFWAIGGTLQGLLTPDQAFSHIDYSYLEYYTDHIGVLVVAAVLIFGLRLRLRRWSALWVAGITIGFTLLDGLVDAVTGGNYMYLRAIPVNGSLLSVLGPWPWYIVAATGIGILLFCLLSVPFWFMSPQPRPATAVGGEGDRLQADALAPAPR